MRGNLHAMISRIQTATTLLRELPDLLPVDPNRALRYLTHNKTPRSIARCDERDILLSLLPTAPNNQYALRRSSSASRCWIPWHHQSAWVIMLGGSTCRPAICVFCVESAAATISGGHRDRSAPREGRSLRRKVLVKDCVHMNGQFG